MSKSALGRGLEELMSGQKLPSNVPTSPAPATPVEGENPLSAPTPEPAADLAEIATPGVGTLLRGKIEAPKTESPKLEVKNPFAEPAVQPKPAVDLSFLKWVLILADVLLIIPTSFFVLTKTTRMTFLEGTLCVVTFVFAACLGCIALFMHRHDKK